MKWLFVYAHPDDESVAAGGTIRKLVDYGDKVALVLATSGEGGKIKNDDLLGMSREKYENMERSKKRDFIKKIRKNELKKACEILGIEHHEVLEFSDGEINNEIVWGELTNSIINSIEKHKPDFLVTFDHTGWYYHLDHVGVSLATVKAMQKAKHKAEGLLFNVFHPPGIEKRWKYHYPEKFSITHKVSIEKEREVKIKALNSHMSQGISLVERIEKGEMDEEYFELAYSTKMGKKIMDDRVFFEKI